MADQVELINVYAPPQEVEDEIRAPEIGDLVAIGFGRRALARILDWGLHLALSFVGGVGAAIACRLVSGHVPPAPKAGDWFIGILFAIAYHTVFEGIAGATPAKALLGLRVLQQNGAPCGLGSALIRSLGYYVDGMFFGFVAYRAMENSAYSQRHGDRWGRTIVVAASSVPRTAVRSGGAFVLALFLTLTVFIVIASVWFSVG